MAPSKRPLKIVFCYAHNDESLLNKLKAHLRPLERQHFIKMWHDREINAGTEREKEIDSAFNAADIILLLISSDFMNSDYCYEVELQKAMERHKRQEVYVIPIILRHTYWQETFESLQALPTDAKPIISVSWHSEDEAFYNVVEGILKVVKQFIPKSPPSSSTSFFQDSLNFSAGKGFFDEQPSPTKLPISQTTLALILGASSWPNAPDLQPSEGFSNSARDFQDYLLNKFHLPQNNLLNLFDTDMSPDDLDRMIWSFLKDRLLEMKNARQDAEYLLIYYVGHGIFSGKNADFSLAIRRTRMENPMSSSISLEILASTLSNCVRSLRQILVFDCAFAGAASRYLESTSREGTSLLCSSSAQSPSLFSPDGSSTMFTEGLLHILNSTDNASQKAGARSLRDVAYLTRNYLRETYGERTPLPEVHSPDQRYLDVAEYPFFP